MILFLLREFNSIQKCLLLMFIEMLVICISTGNSVLKLQQQIKFLFLIFSLCKQKTIALQSISDLQHSAQSNVYFFNTLKLYDFQHYSYSVYFTQMGNVAIKSLTQLIFMYSEIKVNLPKSLCYPKKLPASKINPCDCNIFSTYRNIFYYITTITTFSCASTMLPLAICDTLRNLQKYILSL